MGKNFLRGDAVPVAQVATATVGGTPAAAQVYALTINGKSYSYAASGADTNNTIAAALQLLASANALAIPEFSEVVFTVSGAVVTATAGTPGVPFTLTGSAGGTGTLVVATATPSSGPAHWDDPTNWTLGAVPAAGDEVYLTGVSSDVLYGLGQSGVTLARLEIDSTFTGKLGLPDVNPAGYREYRPRPLAVGATLVVVGRGAGGGSNRVRIDFGTVQASVTVYSTGSPVSAGGFALDLRGSHASNSLDVIKGSVAWNLDPSTTGTLLTVNAGGKDNPLSDVSMLLGDGCAVGTLTASGGQITLRNGATAVTMTDGALTVEGTAGVATLNADGGTVYYQSSGTLGSYRGSNRSLLDFTRNTVARTVTNCTLEAGAGLKDPAKTVTFTNPVSVRCKLAELSVLDLGDQIGLARS